MAGIYYVVTSYIFDYEPGLILAEHRLRHLHKNDDRGRGGHSAWQGRTHGEGEGPGPPWDLKKHYIFRVSSVKLRDLHI